MMSSTCVTPARAVNLYAMAQRGARPVYPRRCCVAVRIHLDDHAVDLVAERLALRLGVG